MARANNCQERTVRDNQERGSAVLDLDGFLAEEQRIVASSSLEWEIADGLTISRPRLRIREIRVGNEVPRPRLDHPPALDAFFALHARWEVEPCAGAVFRILWMNEDPVADDVDGI